MHGTAVTPLHEVEFMLTPWQLEYYGTHCAKIRQLTFLRAVTPLRLTMVKELGITAGARSVSSIEDSEGFVPLSILC